MEEKKQSDDIDFFTDLFKWKMDEEELKNQVENYDILGFFRSARKGAAATMIFLAIISLIFAIIGWISLMVSWIETILTLILAFFVYKGSKGATIITMLYWTFIQGFKIVGSFSFEGYNPGNTIMPFIFWAIFMRVFWQAYQVERERRKKRQD